MSYWGIPPGACTGTEKYKNMICVDTVCKVKVEEIHNQKVHNVILVLVSTTYGDNLLVILNTISPNGAERVENMTAYKL